MKPSTRILTSTALALLMAVPSTSWAQRRGSGNSGSRPKTSQRSNSGSSVRTSGTAQSRPNSNKKSSPTSRPNNNIDGKRPNNPNVNQGNKRPGNSGQKPSGAYRPNVARPNDNYKQPNYRPPRPGGGFWGAPPANTYRPPLRIPPMPPLPTAITPGIPPIGAILGLTFGTFVDASINSLYNAGYNVLGYENNAVYLSNVSQLGYLWPEATIYYTDGLMSNAQFTYWTSTPDAGRYNMVYKTLLSTYGSPASNYTDNGMTYVSWWDGNNTGYVTLSYGPGVSSTGFSTYYTTLTYSDVY